MYKGHIIHVSIGEKTHGNPGVVFFGDIPDEDMAILAPAVRLKECGEDVVPSVVLLNPKDVKSHTFDAKFYWPLGQQGPLCGQGVIMAARAIKDKYSVEDGSIITLLPDQKFGPGAAPEKFHLKVIGDRVLSMLGGVGIAPVSQRAPTYKALASALPDIVGGTIYLSSLGDYMCFYNDIDKLRASTDVFNAVYDKIRAYDPTAFGLLVAAPTKDGRGVEATLSSMGETCITCSNIGLEVGQFMQRFGLLPEADKEGLHSFDIIHPHRVADTGELGATSTIKFNPRTDSARVDLSASVGGNIYLYKDENGAFRQNDRIIPVEHDIRLAHINLARQHRR